MAPHKSEDFKLSAVKHYLKIKNQTETCRIFGCSERSLMRWIEKFKTIKSVKRKTRKYIAYKVKKEYVDFLKKEIKNDKTITISDLTSKLNQKYNEHLRFNFPFILIFYWSLKKIETLGYGYIFIAGMFNDAVLGFPIGISSLTYLIICGFAAYLRNITLRPSQYKDWFYFLFTILVANSINYFLLILFFSVEINYYEILGNIIFTFLFYYIFAYFFDIHRKIISRIKP